MLVLLHLQPVTLQQRCWFCARLSEPEGSIQFGSVEDVHLTYKAFIYKKFPQPYVFFFSFDLYLYLLAERKRTRIVGPAGSSVESDGEFS